MESPPPRKTGDNFIRLWGTLNIYLPLTGLSQTESLKFSTHLVGAEEGQNLLQFAWLFQVKFNFSIEYIFFNVVS